MLYVCMCLILCDARRRDDGNVCDENRCRRCRTTLPKNVIDAFAGAGGGGGGLCFCRTITLGPGMRACNIYASMMYSI